MRIVRRLLAPLCLCLCAASVAEAQLADTPAAARRTAVVTINPFALIFGGFSGDVEFALSPEFSLGAGGTYFAGSSDEFDWKSFDVTGRYFPGARAPEGFSVGLSAGYLDLENEEFLGGGTSTNRGATAGFIVGYTWLLGRTDRLAIALGVGAKRIFGDNTNTEVAGAGRFGIGLAF